MLISTVTGIRHRRLPAVAMTPRNSVRRRDRYLRCGRISSPWHARPRPGHDLVGRRLPLGPLALQSTRIERRSAAPRVPSTLHPRVGPHEADDDVSRGGGPADRVSPIQRSLSTRHLFDRGARGPDEDRGAVGSTLCLMPELPAPPVRIARPASSTGSSAEGRSAWGVSAFGRSVG